MTTDSESRRPTLRFGVSLGGWDTREALLESATRAEANGIDVLTVADHLGSTAPFQVLAAAASVTTRPRLRTYVLDAYFWNPALLAREVATLDRLSGGRVELGVGAGHMRDEHEDAGLPFPPVSQRWDHTRKLLADVRRRLADPAHRPQPLQSPLPLMVAAMGERGLTVAAQVADVVGLAGLASVPGRAPGTFTLVDAATTDERVGLVRRLATEHGRDPELDVLLQSVVLDREPREAAADMARDAAGRGSSWLTAELLLDSPFVLFAGSAEQAARELETRTARWGVTSWSTHAPSAEALAAVAAAHRA